ncbi:unnamed protein product, partial [Didymodactylos carnosus]
ASSKFIDSGNDYERPSNDVQIDAKRVAKLRNEIFSDGNLYTKQFGDKLENAIEFNGYDLFSKFQPLFQDKNKLLLYNTVVEKHKYVPSKSRDVLMTRWLAFPLPNDYNTKFPTDIKFESNVFTYDQNHDKSTVEWHLNFANHDLFSYYSQRLLAQDELQVLECFQLASIREYLCGCKHSFSSHTIDDNRNPTPILISNVERILNMDTTNIYGNRFTRASENEILSASQYLDPPSIVNILAIQAPQGGRGSYSKSEIHYILSTCYTGFMAAKVLASKTHQLNAMQEKGSDGGLPLKTVIHTGWFGCGAYGGNRTLMLVLQIIAAQLAQIDKIMFHTVTNDCGLEKKQARECWEEIGKQRDNWNVEKLIEHLQNQDYRWERPNGT